MQQVTLKVSVMDCLSYLSLQALADDVVATSLDRIQQVMREMRLEIKLWVCEMRLEIKFRIEIQECKSEKHFGLTAQHIERDLEQKFVH